MSLLLAACSGDMVAPRTDQPGGGFGPGSSGGGGAAASLVGVWQTIVTESLAEGFPRTTERACTWTVNGARVAISFVGAGTLTFDFSFAGLSPDRLVLDGFEYQRLS